MTDDARGVTVAELLARNGPTYRPNAPVRPRHLLPDPVGLPGPPAPRSAATVAPASPPAAGRRPPPPRFAPPPPARSTAPPPRSTAPPLPLPRSPAAEPDELELRRRRIDDSFTRLTAAHAGLCRDPTTPAGPREAPPIPAAQPGMARGRARLLGKVLLALAAILVLLISGVGWGAMNWVDGKFRQVSALDPDSDAIQNAAAQRGDQNFLLVGSDSRAGAQPGDDAGNATQVAGARSDTIMVAHIPADRSRVVIVSFPRDLEITRPACEQWDSVSGNYTGLQLPAAPLVKINTAFEVGGPRCVTRIVQQLSGLAVNHFVGIDFQGFKAMVDAVNGVNVCVEQPVRDSVLGTIIDKPGPTTLTGDQALSFVRARHVASDPTSDYGRIQRQQRFLSSLLRTALSSRVLLDPAKLRNFASAFASATFGDNIGLDAVVLLAQSLQRLDASQITFVTLPTTGVANALGNEVLRAAENHALFTAIIEGKPLPGQSPAARAVPAPVAAPAAPVTAPPAQVRVTVRNGTAKAGVANSLAASLTRLGFTVTSVGNTSRQGVHTTISYPADRAAQARTLAAAVPSATLRADDAATGSLSLVIGTDFDGVVQPVRDPLPAASAGAPVPSGLSTVNAGDASCR